MRPLAVTLALVQKIRGVVLTLGSNSEVVTKLATILESPVTRVRLLFRISAEFSDEELEEIARLADKHRRQVGESFLGLLCKIPNLSARRAFAREAIVNGWSTNVAEREYHSRYGVRNRTGGRKPKSGRHVSDMLLKLRGFCVKCTRWYDHEFDGASKPDAESLKVLPETVRVRLVELNRSMSDLYEEVMEALHEDR